MSSLPAAIAAGKQERKSAKSHSSPTPRIWTIAVLVFVLALFSLPQVTQAQLYYTSGNNTVELPVVQLMYDGFWKPVRPPVYYSALILFL